MFTSLTNEKAIKWIKIPATNVEEAKQQEKKTDSIQIKMRERWIKNMAWYVWRKYSAEYVEYGL